MTRTTVLVVDDDADVLDFIAQELARENFRVLTAGTAARALRVAAEHPGSIDLLITDVFLGKQTGPDLAEQIAVKRSDIKVLFITGTPGHPLIERFRAQDNRCLLHKPFSAAELLIKIRTLLDDAEPCTPPFPQFAD